MKPITRKEIYLNQIAENTGGNGGETGLTPITREEMYFDAIVKNTASGGGGGGSDLPAVTSEDNGDVLTVVNGAWDKAAPSGGEYPGWDVVIQAKQDDDTMEYNFNILKGNFSAAWTKATTGLPVTFLVYFYGYYMEDDEEQFLEAFMLSTTALTITDPDAFLLYCISVYGIPDTTLHYARALNLKWTADGITIIEVS